MKHVLILGGGYAGYSTANALNKALKGNVKITIVEKKEAFFFAPSAPRSVVDTSFAPKSFIPYTSLFEKYSNSSVVHATVTEISAESIITSTGKIDFDYLVIATGSSYSGPFNLAGNFTTTEQGLTELKRYSAAIQSAKRIVFVGGGPVSIETAAEIKELFPSKDVTIIHSSDNLLADRFPLKHRTRIQQKIEAQGIKVVLSERVVTPDPNEGVVYETHTLTTKKGTTFESDLTFFCVGNGVPNSQIATTLSPTIVNGRKEIKVKSTLQLSDESFPHIFSLGDVAATGAPKMQVVLDAQIGVVSANLVSSITGGTKLKEYAYSESALMFVSLGKKDAIGIMPWAPGFMTDAMAKMFKSKHLFLDKMSGELNIKHWMA